MKNSLTAVIYLQPDQIFLRIIELPSLKVVNDVRSGLFAIGEDNKTANYRKNMAAITDNIEGFKELISDYQVDDIKFYGAYEDMDSVTASYVGDQLKVRTGLKIEWLNNNQLMAQSMSYIVDQLPEFKNLSKHCLYILSIGLDSSTLAFSIMVILRLHGKLILAGPRFTALLTSYGRRRLIRQKLIRITLVVSLVT